MWLSRSHFFFSFIIIIFFLCLFYSLIHTLYTIILEWSFHFSLSLFDLRVCVCISRTVCVFKVKFELFPLVQFLFFFSSVYLWTRSTEKTHKPTVTHTHKQTKSLFIVSVCHIYIPRICFVLAHCTYYCCCSLVSLSFLIWMLLLVVIVVYYCVLRIFLSSTHCWIPGMTKILIDGVHHHAIAIKSTVSSTQSDSIFVYRF